MVTDRHHVLSVLRYMQIVAAYDNCHPAVDPNSSIGAAQAEQDFQQLTETVAQLRSGPGQPAALSTADGAAVSSSLREPSAATAHSAVLAWDSTGPIESDPANSGPLREALAQYQRRVADLETEVARLQRRGKRPSRDAGSWRSSSCGSGGTARDLLLQGLLASSDSDVASRVRRFCS